MKLNIKFPILKSYSSKQYALIIVDSANVTHYWDFDGTYDGYSTDCHVDLETRICLN